MRNYDYLPDDTDALRAEIAALDARIEELESGEKDAELREDAERYRWFREQMLPDAIQCPISVIWGWATSDDLRSIKSPEELDAAIDAARNEAKPEPATGDVHNAKGGD